MKKKQINFAQFLSLPALALFGVFFVYPLLKGIGMSLTNWDGMGEAQYVGFKNFVDFFSDARAIQDIKTTLIFAFGSALLLNLVGLAYANNEVVYLDDEFPKLIEMAHLLPLKSNTPPFLIFNNVGGWPVERTMRTNQQAVYIEIWPPYVHYYHLSMMIENAKKSGKPVILAAYPAAFRTDTPERALESQLLLSFVIGMHGRDQPACKSRWTSERSRKWVHIFEAVFCVSTETPHLSAGNAEKVL